MSIRKAENCDASNYIFGSRSEREPKARRRNAVIFLSLNEISASTHRVALAWELYRQSQGAAPDDCAKPERLAAPHGRQQLGNREEAS